MSAPLPGKTTGGCAHCRWASAGIYTCPWKLPCGNPCGYVQRGPGTCAYLHPGPVQLVEVTA